MTTNIKAIRVYLPDTEDHSKLDVTDAFISAIGADTDHGFEGITAEFDERLSQPWSLFVERSGYGDSVYMTWESGYKILSDVAEHIEDNGGPMMRVDGDHEVIVWVEVEDGGITIDTLLVDESTGVTVDGVLTMAGLTLEVDLLDESELGEPENPRAIEGIEGTITIPERDAFIIEFIIELTRCQRTYAAVHEDDKTDWSAKELGSLAHDVFTQMIEED